MKATSSISGAAAATDKGFASSGVAGQQTPAGEGFLAMLDGLIQTSGNGQTANQSFSDQLPSAPVHSNDDGDAAVDVADPATAAGADTIPADVAGKDDLSAIVPATLPTQAATAPDTAAITILSPLVATPSVIPQPTKTAPLSVNTASGDDSVTASVIQAGLVPVALPIETAPSTVPVPTTAPVISSLAPADNVTATQIAAPTVTQVAATAPVAVPLPAPAPAAAATDTSIAAPVASKIVAPSDQLQPTAPQQLVSNDETSDSSVAPAKPAKTTTSDQADSDSQQSAILSALFAQAPLPTLPVAQPAAPAAKPVSTGVQSAVLSSVPASVGILPTLSPPPVGGNGNHLASAAVSAPVSESDDSEDEAKPVVSTHGFLASFGIGTASNDQLAASSDSQADAGSSSATPIAPPIEQAKAESIASLFVLPEQSVGKAKSPVSDTANDKIGAPAPADSDISASGITLVHQPGATVAANPTAQVSASAYAAANTPADQVSLSIQRAASTGAQSITVALDPIELGKVVIKLDFSKDGTVQASISADRPETLTMLKNDHSTLTQALQNAGLSTNSGSLSFNLRDGGGSQQQQGFANASSYRNGRDPVAADDAIPSNSTTVQYTVVNGNGRLDMFA